MARHHIQVLTDHVSWRWYVIKIFGGAIFSLWLQGASGSTCQWHFLTQRDLLNFCNRPTGGVAGALLFFFLNLNPHQGRSFRDHIKEFDFIGLATAVSGVVCLLLGFNSSETTCMLTLASESAKTHVR